MVIYFEIRRIKLITINNGTHKEYFMIFTQAVSWTTKRNGRSGEDPATEQRIQNFKTNPRLLFYHASVYSELAGCYRHSPILHFEN